MKRFVTQDYQNNKLSPSFREAFISNILFKYIFIDINIYINTVLNITSFICFGPLFHFCEDFKNKTSVN